MNTRNKRPLLGLLLVLFLSSTFLQAQTKLTGKVTLDGFAVVGLEILNISSEQTATTDAQGEYSIEVKPEEMVVVASEDFEYFRKFISEELYENPTLDIQLVLREQVEVLDEVIVNNSISAEQLGLRLKRKRTRAESQFYRDAKVLNTVNIGLGGGVALNMGAIINAISGKRRYVKQALKLEKYEINYTKLRAFYTNETLMAKFGMNADNCDDFLAYVSMQKETTDRLAKGASDRLNFYLSGLSVKYLANQKEEVLEEL